jgi:predicted O-methyltransferase YrrM
MTVRSRARHLVAPAAAAVALRRGGEPGLARAAGAVYLPLRGEDRHWAKRIEDRRQQLLASTELLDEKGTVGEVTRNASKQPWWCRVLLRLVRETGARSVLEMGTAVGISGSYLAAGVRLNGGGRLITLDGMPGRSAIARAGLQELGLDDIADPWTGRFEDTFKTALTDLAPVDLVYVDGDHQEAPTIEYYEASLPHLSPGAVVVFDDIRWSDGMVRAWRHIARMPATRVAADLSHIGIVRT